MPSNVVTTFQTDYVGISYGCDRVSVPCRRISTRKTESFIKLVYEQLVRVSELGFNSISVICRHVNLML